MGEAEVYAKAASLLLQAEGILIDVIKHIDDEEERKTVYTAVQKIHEATQTLHQLQLKHAKHNLTLKLL